MEQTFAAALRSQRERLNLSQSELIALIPPLTLGVLRSWEREANPRTPPDWAQPLILAHLRRHKPRKSGSFARHGQPSKS